MLVHHLGLVRDSEFMATASDARGCVVWTGGNTKVRDEADRYEFSCGAQWAEMGTNGTRLVTQSLSSGAQIYGPEHWMDFRPAGRAPLSGFSTRILVLVVSTQ
jgi:transcriptional regulator of acetoin/glycerol metabolism